MMYKLREAREARKDLENLVAYMIYSLKKGQAALDFLKLYRNTIDNLIVFPLAYREISFTYQGYEICIKPFSTYNLFYVVDTEQYQITILRVLKNRQNWKAIFQIEGEYSF